MATQIPQHILDELTDVHLPREMAAPPINEHVEIEGIKVPVYRYPAVVLGSGAAGLRAAVELKRRGADVLVVTRKLFWGTSAFSGSDKQTLHTACTKHRGDDFTKMAQALGGGGAMDADVAYVRNGSARFRRLCRTEVSRLAAAGRSIWRSIAATRPTMMNSARWGPPVVGRVPCLMVKALEEATRLNIPFLDHTTGMSLAEAWFGRDRKAADSSSQTGPITTIPTG